MIFRVFFSCVVCAGLFGIWLQNVHAATFMFTLLGTCFTAIDYFKNGADDD